MKTYNIALAVPNDFDPEQLELNLNYPDGYIEIADEGFNDYSKRVESFVAESELKQLQVNDQTVVLFTFPSELAQQNPYAAQLIKQELENILHCQVLGVTNDIEVLAQNSAEAIHMLQQMIDKVNSKSILKLY
jgi:hypothetical protein